MNTSHHGYLLIPMLSVTALSLLSACQVDRIETPAAENYNREFVRQFGAFDTSQSWNTAKRAKATIAPSELAGADRIEVYTAWPGAVNSYLLASYEADRGETLELDIPQGVQNVYVRTLDATGRVLKATYVPVEEGIISLSEQAIPVKTDLSTLHLYDLTNSPAFGGVRLTAENRSFWENFVKNDGTKIEFTDPTKEPDYKYLDTYTPLGVRGGINDLGTLDELDEEWFDLGYIYIPEDKEATATDEEKAYRTWGRNMKSDPLPADIVSNRIEIRVTYKKNSAYSYNQLKIMDGDWHDLHSGVFDLWEDEGTVTLELKDGAVSQAKSCGLRVTGQYAYISKIEFRELKADMSDYEETVKYKDIFNIYGITTAPVAAGNLDGFKQNYLGPNNTYDANGFSASDIVTLVGAKTGRFHEEVNENYECNLNRFRNELNPEAGVEYILQADGEVSVDYFFGAASYFNSFGYFYFDESERTDIAALLKKPKFILAYNAYPGSNLLFEDNSGNWKHDDGLAELWGGSYQANGDDGGTYTQVNIAGYDPENPNNEGKDATGNWQHAMRPKRLVEDAEKGNEGADRLEPDFTGRMRSANYRLVYYQTDENGKPIESTKTYTFPAGTHIGFFIIQGGQYWIRKNDGSGQLVNHRRMAFSRPWMNYYIGNTINGGHSHREGKYSSEVVNGTGAPEPWTAFVSYLWNGTHTLGIEDYNAEVDGKRDGGDHDMNDMLFRINGPVKSQTGDKEMNEEKSPAMSWIVACEDLGGTFDYDFNDVVFGVSHVSGQTKATVTALAAGGTLPIYLQYGGKTLCPQGTNGGEFHSWWGSDNPSYSTINVHNFSKGIGKSIEIDVPEDFSLATTGDAESLAPTHGKPGDTDSDMGGFKVIVTKGDETTNTITAPKPGTDYEAPQMFLVPVDWRWPRERQHISGVYPGFIDWTDGWWRNRDGEAKDNHINHGWKGAPINATK